MSIQSLKNKALQNPAVRAEYDSLEAEFKLIDTLLSMRRKSGLTQEEVAEKMGTQKGNVSRLERGNGNPSLKTLQNYARACGFKLSMEVHPLSTKFAPLKQSPTKVLKAAAKSRISKSINY